MSETTARSDAIRQWLLRKPRPASVRVTSVAGEVADVKIPESPRWRDVADTLDSLDPATLHAHDSEGNILRAEKLSEPPAEIPEAPEPEVPAVLHNDPETARVTHFANLIHRAYEHTTTVAFDKLVDMVDRMNVRAEAQEARMERIEAAYQAEMHARFQEQLQAAQENHGEDGIMQSFLGGAKAGREQSNGKAPAGFGKSQGGDA